MAYNDAELIKLTLEGDDTAFGFLVDKYKGAVHALAYRKLGDFQIAEEITQDTFLKAYQNLRNLKDPARFPGWLYVIAARRCISWQRKKRLTTQSLEDVDETQMQSLNWSKYMDMQSRQEVHDALESLPESDRTVLTLYYLGGLTCEEIAQFIGTSRDAVKGRLYRARCRMKEEIMKTIEQDWSIFQLPPAFTQRIVEWIRPLTPTTPASSKPLTPWIAAATLAVATLLVGLGLMQTTTYQFPYSLTNTESEFMVELTEAPISETLTPKQSNVNRSGGGNAHGIGHGNTSEGPLLALAAGAQSERKTGEIVWKQTNGPYGGFICSLLVIPEDGTIYAGTKDGGVFRSDDGGNSWVQRNKGLDIPYVETLTHVGKTIYAGTGFGGGVFRSDDGGSSWKHSGLKMSTIKVLTTSEDGTLYASALQKGIFRSDDGGSSWTQLDKGPIDPNGVMWSLVISDNTLYTGTPGGSIFYSQDKGDSWTEMKSKFTAKNIYALVISGNTLYAGTAGDGIFRSTDSGNSWTPINTGLTRNIVHSIAVLGNDLYAGADGAIFHSEDGGDSWREFSTGLTDQRVLSIAVFDSNLYAGTAGFGLLHSNDRGQTWAQVKTGLTNQQVKTLVFWGQTLYAGAENGGVSRSEDGGMSWVSVNTGLPSQSGMSLAIYDLKVIGNSLYAGTARGVFRMESGSNSWTPNNTGLIMSFQGHEMTPQIMSLISMGTTIYAGAFEGGVFRSEDDGKSWKQVNTGLTDKKVQSLAVMGTTTPEPPTHPLPPPRRGLRGTTLYAGTWEGGVFRSEDRGDSWTQINTGLTVQLKDKKMIPQVNALTVVGEALYAGTMAGVFRSENGGDSWTLVNVGLTYKSGGKERTQPVQSLAVSGTTLYAGTGAGVFYSEDGGNSWAQISTGLKHEFVRALAVSETDLYVGTFGGGVYRALLSR